MCRTFFSFAKILSPECRTSNLFECYAEYNISYAKIRENADKAKKSCPFFEKNNSHGSFLIKSSTFVGKKEIRR